MRRDPSTKTATTTTGCPNPCGYEALDWCGSCDDEMHDTGDLNNTTINAPIATKVAPETKKKALTKSVTATTTRASPKKRSLFPIRRPRRQVAAPVVMVETTTSGSSSASSTSTEASSVPSDLLVDESAVVTAVGWPTPSAAADTNEEERYMGPIDLDTMSEECVDVAEHDGEQWKDDHHHHNPPSHDDESSRTNIDLVTTNTSDIFASILPTNDSDDPNNNNNNRNDTHHHIEPLEVTNDEDDRVALPQPILPVPPTDDECLFDCHSLLLSSLTTMMMALPTTTEEHPAPTSQQSPLLTTTFEQIPQQQESKSAEMIKDEEMVVELQHSMSIVTGKALAAAAPPTVSVEEPKEHEILKEIPSGSSSSKSAMTPPQFDHPTTPTTATTTTIDPLIDPLLLLLQQSSSAMEPKQRLHPNELDAMLLRVLEQQRQDDETTTVASTDGKTTTMEPTIFMDGGLMEALAAGPVDVDDFIPEDSYWAMDTHEFILDELEFTRQLIGYHEGCEPPMINDISLLTDDDDDEEDDPVPVMKAMKRDVRRDLILQRTNKMTRQRTSATADSNELIRRSQAIQQQQQQFMLGGVSQRPATITQKNRIRSDPSVVPSRTTTTLSHAGARFPTPTIMSRQKPTTTQRQPVSPRNRRLEKPRKSPVPAIVPTQNITKRLPSSSLRMMTTTPPSRPKNVSSVVRVVDIDISTSVQRRPAAAYKYSTTAAEV